MTDENFTIGQCSICGKNTGLKNGVCGDCKAKQPEMPDFFSDLMKQFDDGK